MAIIDDPSKCPDLTGLIFKDNKNGSLWKIRGPAEKGYTCGCVYPIVKCTKNGKEYLNSTRYSVEPLIDLSKFNNGETYSQQGCNLTKIGMATSNQKIELKNPQLTGVKTNISIVRRKIEDCKRQLKRYEQDLQELQEEMIEIMGCEELI